MTLLTAELEAARAAREQTATALAELQGHHQTTLATHQERLAALDAELPLLRADREKIELEHQATVQAANETLVRVEETQRQLEVARAEVDHLRAQLNQLHDDTRGTGRRVDSGGGIAPNGAHADRGRGSGSRTNGRGVTQSFGRPES